VSTRKNSGAVDAADAVVDDSVDAEAGVEGGVAAAVEAGFDPELDTVAADELASDAGASDEADGAADTESAEGTASKKHVSKLKIVVGALSALAVAAVAVVAAGALGGSDATGLPETVTEPTVVLTALNEGGIACTGSAVSGEVATCNATVAVRVFEGPGAAEAYVSDLLKSPLTSSAIGWVRHGNVVVAAPLTATPEIAAALGEGSQIY
jgi:hypothetical protein